MQTGVIAPPGELGGGERVGLAGVRVFELAVAPDSAMTFANPLLRMCRWRSAGDTDSVTSELEDRYTDLRFSPYGTAFMIEAIIVRRYVEMESRLRPSWPSAAPARIPTNWASSRCATTPSKSARC